MFCLCVHINTSSNNHFKMLLNNISEEILLISISLLKSSILWRFSKAVWQVWGGYKFKQSYLAHTIVSGQNLTTFSEASSGIARNSWALHLRWWPPRKVHLRKGKILDRERGGQILPECISVFHFGILFQIEVSDFAAWDPKLTPFNIPPATEHQIDGTFNSLITYHTIC